MAASERKRIRKTKKKIVDTVFIRLNHTLLINYYYTQHDELKGKQKRINNN